MSRPPVGVLTVAIIGGGAAGTLAAIHLAAHPSTTRRRVVVFEPAAELGEGAAYGTRSPSHLLNVRASGMSAYPDDPGHFHAWTAASGHVVSAADFLPRMWYAAYLREALTAAVRDRGKITVEHRRARATALERGASGGWSVRLDRGRVIRPDHVVLATGNALAPARDTPAHPGFVADPWLPGAIERLRDASEVLIVGSGLTAVDVVLTLRDVGHAGHIRMISSHGLLPAAHLPDPLPAIAPFVESGTTSAASVRGSLAAARVAARQAADWRQVIDGVRSQAVSIWRDWSPSERRRFLRHLCRRWDVRRHRMAPQVAAAVTELQATGALTLGRGRVRATRDANGRIRATVERAGRLADWDVDAVVLCVGPSTDPRHDPFLAGLLAGALATRHPLGLGLDVDPVGRVRAPDGVTWPDLWAMGSLRKGAEWESTAVPELRLHARDIAAAILDN